MALHEYYYATYTGTSALDEIANLIADATGSTVETSGTLGNDYRFININGYYFCIRRYNSYDLHIYIANSIRELDYSNYYYVRMEDFVLTNSYPHSYKVIFDNNKLTIAWANDGNQITWCGTTIVKHTNIIDSESYNFADISIVNSSCVHSFETDDNAINADSSYITTLPTETLKTTTTATALLKKMYSKGIASKGGFLGIELTNMYKVSVTPDFTLNPWHRYSINSITYMYVGNDIMIKM